MEAGAGWEPRWVLAPLSPCLCVCCGLMDANPIGCRGFASGGAIPWVGVLKV